MPALPILHLDQDLVIVSKPAGMLVHHDQFSWRETVALQTVAEQLGRFLYPVHRLDRNTSGILAFGCSSEMARAVHEALRSPEAHKEYLTLARGLTEGSFVSERPLTQNGQPRPARTDFRRLASFSRCSLLEAKLATGRRHQIRRHLAHLAHQIIGDSSYGKGRINQWFREQHGLPRMFLHARRLMIPHPRTGERLEVIDPLPEDLLGFLGRLPDVEAGLLQALAGR